MRLGRNKDMQTKYDVGDEVYMKVTIESILAEADGIEYRVKLPLSDAKYFDAHAMVYEDVLTSFGEVFNKEKHK